MSFTTNEDLEGFSVGSVCDDIKCYYDNISCDWTNLITEEGTPAEISGDIEWYRSCETTSNSNEKLKWFLCFQRQNCVFEKKKNLVDQHDEIQDEQDEQHNQMLVKCPDGPTCQVPFKECVEVRQNVQGARSRRGKCEIYSEI